MKKMLCVLIFVIGMTGCGVPLDDVVLLEQEIVFLKESLHSATSELADANETLYETKESVSRLAHIVNETRCKVDAEIDYTSNYTVAESIKESLEEVYESIDDYEWEAVWNNSTDVFYHRQNGEYLYPFVVFFENEDTNTLNGVFSLTGQCWLGGLE